MDNPAVTIQCSHPNCQAANSLENQSCSQCHTPLLKRYLWGIGDWLKAYRVGECIGGRYLLKHPRILLDTQPHLPLQGPQEVPPHLLPYLKLFPHRLHLPQLYGYLPSPDDQLDLEIWFLEYGTVPLDGSGNLKYPNLLPELDQLWPEAPALRQLNWLGQMARLWQPLKDRGVTSSLLDPFLLRVNGGRLQLLELQPDPAEVPTLKQLGQLWSQWAGHGSSQVAEFLQDLARQLAGEELTDLDQLLTCLDLAVQQCGKGYQRTYQIFTGTDTGPGRTHNEDACFPASGTLRQLKEGEEALTVVCDGIGGQEGGEIASQLAIETLLKELNAFPSTLWEGNPDGGIRVLERAICQANDQIAERNDRENRQERQRMGTTLVMSWVNGQEIYVAHVGDSRAYWITSESCHQVTVDDDLASREVRLGYLLYRDAIQYPNAGALVQALGMSSSISLQPTVQRFVPDGDCLLLLCSDGLSDYDRVEQYWQRELVPVLAGETDLAAAGQQLIEIANRQNGHDNVTVALIYCQVRPGGGGEAIPLSWADVETALAVPPPSSGGSTDQESEEVTAPDLSPSCRRLGPLTLAVVLGLLGLGGTAYGLWHLAIRPRLQESESLPSPPLVSPALPSPPSSPRGL